MTLDQSLNIRLRLIILWLFTITLFVQKLHAQNVQQGEEVHLHLAVPIRVFDDLTRKDAQLAIDMWTKEIINTVKETNGIQFSVSSSFLENEYEKVDFTEHENYDILLLGALDFIDFKLEYVWDPVALTAGTGHFPEEYVVLSRKDRKYKNINDLNGKEIVCTKNQDARIILYWLNNLLRTKHLGTVDQFFSSMEQVQKDSKSVLSVFFNKTDACVVGYNHFKTMTELNPQIGHDLEIVVESPPFARGMVCLKKTLDKQVKEIVTSAVLELPNSPRGKQILKYFGQSNLIPYQAEYIKTFYELVRNSKKPMEPNG